MPQIQKLLRNPDFVNTWGDAIVATFESPVDAAKSALAIRDHFIQSSPEEGITSGLSCRVALHLGTVMLLPNPLRQGSQDIFGYDVHMAARLEPATEPGYVFCTDAFQGALAKLGSMVPKTWPLGTIELPKGFGSVNVHVVTHTNDRNPNLALKTPSAPAPVPSPSTPPRPKMSPAATKAALRVWLSSQVTPRTFTFEDIIKNFPGHRDMDEETIGLVLPGVLKEMGFEGEVHESIVALYSHESGR